VQDVKAVWVTAHEGQTLAHDERIQKGVSPDVLVKVDQHGSEVKAD
jgi:hypothetical protein